MLSRFRAHPGLVAVVGGYYVVFVVVGLIGGSSQTAFYAMLLPLLVVLVAVLDARRPFSPIVLWGLALWGALHMAGGLVPASGDRVLYNVWLLPFVRFDHLVHAIGFGFAGLAFFEAVREPSRTRAAGPALVFFGGVGVGAINEMVEFLISRVREDTNIGGFENTGWDLVANTVGAVVAAVWIRSRSSSRLREGAGSD